MQSVVVHVKGVTTQLLRIVCTCAYLFVRVLFFSSFLHVTCTDDPHRLKCAIKSQIFPQLISLSIHGVSSLNKVPKDLEIWNVLSLDDLPNMNFRMVAEA